MTHLGGLVELGEAVDKVIQPALRHHKLGQDGHMGVRALEQRPIGENVKKFQGPQTQAGWSRRCLGP